jgi:uncharacterized coiled-coil DUF342 family protein
MRQQTEILQIKVSKDIVKYLRILDDKYQINRSQFVRNAILEKLKKDVPKLRIEKQNIKMPF